jgi:antitoxin VapB
MSATAKLFMHGRSQAVRLPREFRFEGTEVRVSKVGDKVILEPLNKPPIDLDKFWADLDALGQGISCRTAFLTIRRSNRIRASSSTNDLPRHQHRHRDRQRTQFIASPPPRDDAAGGTWALPEGGPHQA